MRTVVPDADLRSYESPEPVGYTTSGEKWTDLGKHKTRWSIYSLRYVLKQTGFNTFGVIFCDKHGKYHNYTNLLNIEYYKDVVDKQFVNDFSYINRIKHSLIVDAIKPIEK